MGKIQRHHALGDVGQRQKRQRFLVLANRIGPAQRIRGPQHVEVGQHGAFRRAGGARRVDEQRHVVGLDPCRCVRPERRDAGARSRRRALPAPPGPSLCRAESRASPSVSMTKTRSTWGTWSSICKYLSSCSSFSTKKKRASAWESTYWHCSGAVGGVNGRTDAAGTLGWPGRRTAIRAGFRR